MAKSSRASPHGEGYIMLYRKSLTSAVFQDEKTWKVWSWCVLRANWQTIPIDFDGEEVVLMRGQFATGSHSMVGELGMSMTTIWRHLRKLEKWGNIGIKTGRRWTVISVINYDVYQDPTRSEFAVDGIQTDSQRFSNGFETGTDKKVISEEVKKSKRNKARPDSLEDVRAYFLERGEPDASAAWWDHFESNGWKVGKALAPMADWKAAVRTWIGNAKKWGDNGTTGKDNRRTNQRSGGERETFTDSTTRRVLALNPIPAGANKGAGDSGDHSSSRNGKTTEPTPDRPGT